MCYVIPENDKLGYRYSKIQFRKFGNKFKTAVENPRKLSNAALHFLISFCQNTVGIFYYLDHLLAMDISEIY